MSSWSTRFRPARGPSLIATATARFSATTGPGRSVISRSYSSAICAQSVSPGVAAVAWQAAIAACS